MQENLVIVESPAKAKTIEKFLGKEFMVKSSFGHIRDLAKKGLGIELENNFEPLYEIPEDKRKVVDELSRLETEVDVAKKRLSRNHFERLAVGNCRMELSAYFFSTVTGLERIADHLLNVGYSILNPTGSQAEDA